MDRKTLWILIRDYMGKRAVIYFGAILLMGILGSLFQIMISGIIGDLCNLAQQGSMDGLQEVLGRNLPIAILIIGCNVLCSVIYNNEAKRASVRISNAVYTKALLLPVSFYDMHHSGEFMSKVIWDAGRTGDIFGSRLRRMIMPILTVIVCIGPMFYLCAPVMAGLLLLSIVSLVMHSLMIKPMKKAAALGSDANQEMTKNISNFLQGIEVIKMFPVREKVLRAYDEANRKLEGANRKQANYSALLNGLNTAFGLIGGFWFLALGIWYIAVYGGQIGSLVSLYILYGTFHWNFLQIGLYVPDLANCLVNAERIVEFMEQEEEGYSWLKNESIQTLTLDQANAMIAVDKLTFGYYGVEETVMKNYSVLFPKGVCAAITGKSGHGKSTLAKLLLGFYQPQRGIIYIDGKPVRGMTLAQLRNNIAYVPQEPYLYNISIADNIRCGKPDASREEIERAAKAAYAHDFIVRLDQGYETIAGERGAKLSGGEKQRIAIARAILKDAPILLLDEATSALDNESEILVQDAIRQLKGNKTIIMIAHRPSTIAMADYVVEI